MKMGRSHRSLIVISGVLLVAVAVKARFGRGTRRESDPARRGEQKGDCLSQRDGGIDGAKAKSRDGHQDRSWRPARRQHAGGPLAIVER
jgi:hypothetical protein